MKIAIRKNIHNMSKIYAGKSKKKTLENWKKKSWVPMNPSKAWKAKIEGYIFLAI